MKTTAPVELIKMPVTVSARLPARAHTGASNYYYPGPRRSLQYRMYRMPPRQTEGYHRYGPDGLVRSAQINGDVIDIYA